MKRSKHIKEWALDKIEWVLDENDLLKLTAKLQDETLIALDVETLMYSSTLCLVQIGTPHRIYLIDPFSLDSDKLKKYLDPLFNDPKRKILIHNASFERRILGQLGITISNIVDTLQLSRKQRGRKLAGGHSLKVVCERELGITLSKEQQTSDWSLRPLSRAQIEYAALDVEVLLALYHCFDIESVDSSISR